MILMRLRLSPHVRTAVFSHPIEARDRAAWNHFGTAISASMKDRQFNTHR
jgi:hypothetical protein